MVFFHSPLHFNYKLVFTVTKITEQLFLSADFYPSCRTATDGHPATRIITIIMGPFYYEVKIGWLFDRLGQLSSPQLKKDIEVATPPEFPNGMSGVWSPEHLLVAAVSSCFMTTFLAIAENSKLAFCDFDCRAVGKLESIDNKLIVSAIELFPVVVLAYESDSEKAVRVLQKTEKSCLISHSIRSTITMQVMIKISSHELD